MGAIARLFGRVPDITSFDSDVAGPAFSGPIDTDDIPASFFGLTSYDDVIAPAARVGRRSAMQVPAVKRARDLIAGTLGSLPVKLFMADKTEAYSSLLEQPERGIPRSVTMARTFEDMLFEGVAWWLVVETTWNGYPAKVRRLDPRTVTVRQDGKVYYTKAGNSGVVYEYASDFDLIRFDSPNDPLLVAGARAIRAAAALDAAAARYSSGDQPLDYFTPTDGVDPSQEAVDAAMDAWLEARRIRATGYVPGAFTYHTNAWNPEQLQLAAARDHAVLELARVAGIDPEDLGVSTTSRTYFNAFDRKQARIQDTLRGYALALEDRLSMGDVTPRGYRVAVDFSDMLRSDDVTRFQAYQLGLQVGVYADTNEVRASEGRPLLDTPVPATQPQQPVDVGQITARTDQEVTRG
jgi:phage portal protein BeeE